jgi:hypothetical protein
MELLRSPPRAAYPKERQPTRISGIPEVWFVKSGNEAAYPHAPRLLEMLKTESSDKKRRFVLAELTSRDETLAIIRLGSHFYDNNSHNAIADNLKNDVLAIDPDANVKILGGGFVHADYNERVVYFECKSARVGPADLDTVMALLKEGLPKLSREYHEFRIIGWVAKDEERGIRAGPRKESVIP